MTCKDPDPPSYRFQEYGVSIAFTPRDVTCATCGGFAPCFQELKWPDFAQLSRMLREASERREADMAKVLFNDV